MLQLVLFVLKLIFVYVSEKSDQNKQNSQLIAKEQALTAKGKMFEFYFSHSNLEISRWFLRRSSLPYCLALQLAVKATKVTG